MKNITIEDLKAMSVVELKAFVYDQTVMIQNLNKGIKIAEDIMAEKSKQPEDKLSEPAE